MSFKDFLNQAWSDHATQVAARLAKGNSAEYLKAINQVKSHFSQLSDDDKSWCEETLKKFD